MQCWFSYRLKELVRYVRDLRCSSTVDKIVEIMLEVTATDTVCLALCAQALTTFSHLGSSRQPHRFALLVNDSVRTPLKATATVASNFHEESRVLESTRENADELL